MFKLKFVSGLLAAVLLCGALPCSAVDAATAIDYVKAQKLMVGDETGVFRPDDTLSRAEAAQVLYNMAARTGEPSADAAIPFTDLTTDWSKRAVAYCYGKGIVSDTDATHFTPNSAVTGTEAIKMVLVALGHDAAGEGLTGPDWQHNTLALADELGILEGIDAMFSGPLPRRCMAQLVYNADHNV